MLIIYLAASSFFKAAHVEAKQMGHEVVNIIPRGAHADNFLVGDKQFEMDEIDFKSVSDLLNGPNFHRRDLVQRQDLVFITFKDYWLPLVAQLNASFSEQTAVVSPAEALVTKDKFLMREKLTGSPWNPHYKLLASEKSRLSDLPESRSGKWVIKPTLGYNSIGVEVVGSHDEIISRARALAPLLQEVAKSVSDIETQSRLRASTSLLVEEYIEGEEFSVELLVEGGKTTVIEICSKSPMRAPYFEEISYTAPCDRSKSDRDKLYLASIGIMQRLSIKNAAAHLEFRVSNGEVYLIDIGLRIGGSGLAHELIEISSGRNFLGAYLGLLSGKTTTSFLEANRDDIAVLFLTQVGGGGIIAALPSSEIKPDLASHSVSEFYFNRPGDVVRPYPNYSGHPGFHLFKVDGRSDASFRKQHQLIEDCLSNLKIIYK